LLPASRAAGYEGSLRNLRRLVAKVKADWRRRRRVYRPWQPIPGEHLVCAWTEYRGLHMFCAVLAWSRWRFVRFASDERRQTTLRLLWECFEELEGVPAVVLVDRMACLKAGVVANVVVPHPDYVRFAAHYRWPPAPFGREEVVPLAEWQVKVSEGDLLFVRVSRCRGRVLPRRRPLRGTEDGVGGGN